MLAIKEALMGENERIHGDEDYVAEQERAAAEEAVEVGGGPVTATRPTSPSVRWPRPARASRRASSWPSRS